MATTILLAYPAHADTVNLPASQDNTLLEHVIGGLSNGAGEYFFAGRTQSQEIRRAVLAFDVASAVPAGSTMQSVTLTLYVSRTTAGVEPIELHRLLADWGEGTSDALGEEGGGAASTPGDATWKHTFWDTAFWSSDGGDYVAQASDTTSVGGIGFHSWTSASMATDVQGWLDSPSSNFGWILIGDEIGLRTTKRFNSRTSPSASTRPELTIVYTPPVTDGACCVVGSGCSVVEPADCTTLGGSYQGTGTSCTPDPCTPPGACCFGNGACDELTATACGSQGGSFQGQGTGCVPNSCPQPMGACCATSGVCTDGTELDCDASGGSFQGDGTSCAALECPVLLTPYLDPLPVPAVATPVGGVPGGAARYDIAMKEFRQTLHSELPATTVWGYDDGAGATFPGPTIESFSNQPVDVDWINDLRELGTGNLRTDHYLAVDTACVHGAENKAKAVVHLHGGHVTEEADGYPEFTYDPGLSDLYAYANRQIAGTLWYHDHALGITRLNVYMGLAGFYIVRDSTELSRNLPAGEHEIPLALQDRKFNPDGSLLYPAVWQDHFFGDKVVVNGKVWPYLDVKQGKYRFRILNGSGSRVYTLALVPPSGSLDFTVIGTEGGLLQAPVPGLSTLTLGPGERIDVVVDFAGLAGGTEILLENSAPAPFPSGTVDLTTVMKFVVQPQAGHVDALPPFLRTLERLQESDSVASRDFRLKREADDGCGRQNWLINGLGWDDITEYPELETVEIWRFINDSGVSHPMHMHLVMFQILDRDTFTVGGGGEIIPDGNPQSPAAWEDGWKDTVMVHPGEMVRVIARFEDYKGRFAYHCHILEHEDHEMMRQFQTVRCGDATLDPTEQCDDGGLAPLDGCSPTCRAEEFVTLSGTAAGGSVQLIVSGVTVTVPTSPGQTAEQVAQALADAINADIDLQAGGVTATAVDDKVVVDSTIDSVTLGDTGLTDRLQLTLQRTRLWWSSVGGAAGYDLVRGDLATLFAGPGDFAGSTRVCLANDRDETFYEDGAALPSGDGFWYLIRAQPGGSWDSGSTSQSGSRDPGIAASGHDCP